MTIVSRQPVPPGGADPQTAQPLRRAGIVSRIVALVIDAVVVTSGVAVATSFTFSMWSTFLGQVPTFAKAIATVAIALTPSVYFFAFVWFGGRTPGDMLMGLRVVRADGDPVRLVGAFVHGAVGVLLALIWLPGLALIVLDDDRRALHDRVFATTVVYAGRKLPSQVEGDQSPRRAARAAAASARNSER